MGIANGLAWTSVGGEMLPVEVSVVPGGSGKIELTGSLGDVMKESAQLAVTYARVHAQQYGIAARCVQEFRRPHPCARGRRAQRRAFGRRDADDGADLGAVRFGRCATTWP